MRAFRDNDNMEIHYPGGPHCFMSRECKTDKIPWEQRFAIKRDERLIGGKASWSLPSSFQSFSSSSSGCGVRSGMDDEKHSCGDRPRSDADIRRDSLRQCCGRSTSRKHFILCGTRPIRVDLSIYTEDLSVPGDNIVMRTDVTYNLPVIIGGFIPGLPTDNILPATSTTMRRE
jgi:hypothetical protein